MIVWMDMSAAPKDGTSVLLWIEEDGGDGNIIEGRYNAGYGGLWDLVSFEPHGCGCCGQSLREDDIKAWASKPEKPEFLNEKPYTGEEFMENDTIYIAMKSEDGVIRFYDEKTGDELK